MKYQFVDCRWELGKPERGRDLYLEGHIPGASFLDVDTDLSAPAGPRGRHPLPGQDEFVRAAGSTSAKPTASRPKLVGQMLGLTSLTSRSRVKERLPEATGQHYPISSN